MSKREEELLCLTVDAFVCIVFFLVTDEMPNGQPEGESSDLTYTLLLPKRHANVMTELEHKR